MKKLEAIMDHGHRSVVYMISSLIKVNVYMPLENINNQLVFHFPFEIRKLRIYIAKPKIARKLNAADAKTKYIYI